MDNEILRAILGSCESVSKDLENVEDYRKLLQGESFLPKCDIILSSVCTSLTKLLYYKVSKEAYQRYSVRLHIIDILRDWCRITTGLQQSRIFTSEKQTFRLIETLLEKHLTDDILKNCASDVDLLPLASALMCLASKSPSHAQHIDKVLTQLCKVELSNEGENFLRSILIKECKVNLNMSTIEAICSLQKDRLVEEPILVHFMSSCTGLNKYENGDDPAKKLLPVNRLFEYASESPLIFQLLCVVLKELFVTLDYSAKVFDFVQLVIKHIAELRKRNGKNILDLYPRRLQSNIILLEIEPLYHTDESRRVTIRFLEKVYGENKEIAMILLSHFPAWLGPFKKHFIENGDVSPNRTMRMK